MIRLAHYVKIVCINNMVYAKYLLFFWESGIWVHDRQRLSMWPSPSKNSAVIPREAFMVDISHNLSQLISKRIKCIPCDSFGEDPCTWLPLDFAHVPFPLCWLCLVSFCCNKSLLWLWLYAVSCASCYGVPKLEVVLGPPNIIIIMLP